MNARSEIRQLRGPKLGLTAWSVPKVDVAIETDESGSPIEVTTIYLVGAECKFTCSMCDLWRYTLDVDTPLKSIPHQLRQGFQTRPHSSHDLPRWLKLYNASNFFDEASVPSSDWEEIIGLVQRFDRVIVENHPKLCGSEMVRFASALHSIKLEVAIGLESSDPAILNRLNKQFQTSDYENAVALCHANAIAVRTFLVLLDSGDDPTRFHSTWNSVEYALSQDIRHLSIIPLRSGNGWVDREIIAGRIQRMTLDSIIDFWKSIPQCVLTKLNENRLNRRFKLEFDLWDWGEIIGDPIEKSDWHRQLSRWNDEQTTLPTLS